MHLARSSWIRLQRSSSPGDFPKRKYRRSQVSSGAGGAEQWEGGDPGRSANPGLRTSRNTFLPGGFLPLLQCCLCERVCAASVRSAATSLMTVAVGGSYLDDMPSDTLTTCLTKLPAQTPRTQVATRSGSSESRFCEALYRMRPGSSRPLCSMAAALWWCGCRRAVTGQPPVRAGAARA